MQIAKNTVAKLNYVLSDAEGQVLDSTEGREPMMYLHGTGGIIAGLESVLEGKSAGDVVKVTLPPEQAFGAKNPKLLIPVPRADFAGVDEIKLGMRFHAQSENGTRLVTVVAMDEETVTVDANHPWAGLTVTCEATVIEVRAASAEEVDHGHVCYGDGSCGRKCH